MPHGRHEHAGIKQLSDEKFTTHCMHLRITEGNEHWYSLQMSFLGGVRSQLYVLKGQRINA